MEFPQTQNPEAAMQKVEATSNPEFDVARTIADILMTTKEIDRIRNETVTSKPDEIEYPLDDWGYAA